MNLGRDKASDLAMQEEMFWRDLNEVHLLMDYISGRNDKSLTDLDDVPSLEPGAAPPRLTPQQALHRVCLIRFPPVGSLDDKADQAALLLLVKDRLNALASPARGLSIAFTALFATINIREEKETFRAQAATGTNGSQARVQSGGGLRFGRLSEPGIPGREVPPLLQVAPEHHRGLVDRHVPHLLGCAYLRPNPT